MSLKTELFRNEKEVREIFMPMQNFEDRTFSKGSSLQGRIFNMNKQALRKTFFS